MGEGRGGGEAEFTFDILAVGLDGLEAEVEMGGDGFGGKTPAELLEDFQLAIGEQFLRGTGGLGRVFSYLQEEVLDL